MSDKNQFYSRFSLSKSQPYLLTHEYECKGMKIPGMQWVPDFSLWNVNNPNMPDGPLLKNMAPEQSKHICNVCHRFPGAECGYQFWTTREIKGNPQPSVSCVKNIPAGSKEYDPKLFTQPTCNTLTRKLW